MISWLSMRGKRVKNLLLLELLKARVKQLGSSPTVRAISGLAGGNLLAIAVVFIGSFVQARYVAPSDLGYLRGFSIATGYVFFLNLGLFEAVQRLYPYYIGKGEQQRAIALAEISQAWNVAITVVVASAFIILAIVSLLIGNWRAALGWLVQAIGISSSIYGGYLAATYRSNQDFHTVAKGSVISSAANLFTLPIFVFWPYIALVLRSSIGSFVNLLYLHIRRPLRLHWRFNWKEWFVLIKQGLPIFIAGYGATTLSSVLEATIVLVYLGARALGLWTMSVMLFEAVNKIPQAINTVYFPRVYETYGRTGRVSECWRLCRSPIVWGLPGMLLISAFAWVVLPIIVPILIPKYVAAVPIMCLMMLILSMNVLELPYAFLIALGETGQQNIVVYMGLGSFVLLALVAIRLDLGLIGVVAASLLGRVLRILLTYGILASSHQSK